MSGKVIDLQVTDRGGEKLVSAAAVKLIPGKGIMGDRYFLGRGTFSKKLHGRPDCEVTLIESEQIRAFNQATGFECTPGDFRRNIVTQGVDLNALVGKAFNIGGVRFKGIRLCEPCAHLSALLGQEVLEHMVHKAGIRAQVLSEGEIRIADEIG